MVHGEVAPGFEPVRDAFERCFSDLGETGASFAAVLDGRLVVDLWGGDGIDRDSLVNVYSVTKPMAACCVLVLVDRGALSLEDPVSRHWPEFAQAGKDRITVRQLLSHQAGLVALREPQPSDAMFDWGRICSLLAAEPPWWEPGTAHGEHALFYGHLCGELVRRIDGRTLGRFWREEVAEPWSLDFVIGLCADEQARAVDLTGELPAAEDEHALYARAVGNPPGLRDLAVINGERWRAAEIPAVNGHGNAVAVARFYAGLLAGGELEGVRLFSPGIVEAMTAGEMTGPDLVFEDQATWGLGVAIDSDGYGLGGLGGSLGWADPQLGLAEAYVTRLMRDHGRAEAMDAAIRAALA
ncbi:MAG TPA: serine hydrolase domain-containing protein [Solirubrobacteraceae bacterium]|nr:serine hydrolase domain-containing protein [Solirubrobacteraceae bacterium]